MVVETALVAPFVILTMFLILEAGWFLKTHLSVEQAASYGARTAVIAGASEDADVLVLDEIENRLIHGRSDVQRVVVYHAASHDAGPPASCVTGGSPGSAADECTVYTAGDFDLAYGSLACAWCPADRVPTELVGVWVQYRYESITGLVGSRTLTHNFVLQLEIPAGP